MGQGSKQAVYPYTFRIVAAADQTLCSYRAFIYIVPPDLALTIERLNMHFVFQFDAAIATADRVLESVGITDEFPFTAGTDANYQRRQAVNLTADGNRRVDLNIDLTHLLNPENVGYREEELGSDPETGYTMVEVLLPISI